jgi:sugar lactone lactonase YvrE
LFILIVAASNVQASTFTLGVTNFLVGPSVGSNSVILTVTPTNLAWTATANATWLHLGAQYQSGAGNTLIVFSYDTNTGPTRMGNLTMAGTTVTVTQAGSTYTQGSAATGLISPGPCTGIAVDQSDIIYAGIEVSTWTDALMKLSEPNDVLTALGTSGSTGIATDASGNVYIADFYGGAVRKWSASDSALTTLVSSGLNYPFGVAVDSLGNVYIADTYNNAIKKWSATSQLVTTLVSNGLSQPHGVAVDAFGNVYIADTDNGKIKEWSPVTQSVTALFSWGGPYGIAVDGSGNVYVAAYSNGAIMKWMPVNNTLTTLVSPLGNPDAVAVSSMGDVYIGGYITIGSVAKFQNAYIDPTPKLEGVASGSDVLPVVVPATANLIGPFAPTSDQPWLTITGVTNGVVSFSFGPITGPSRTGHITMLGQVIPVTQAAIATYALGTNVLTEASAAGTDTILLTVSPNVGPWTAFSGASWLHLGDSDTSGVGSKSIVFGFDANRGAVRSGTISIAGQILTVTQDGIPEFVDTNVLLEGPSAGMDSIVVPWNLNSNGWTGAPNTNWLHLDSANSSGTNSANVVFSFDANPGPTRFGTLTIAGQTYNVTQAGSTYVPAGIEADPVSTGGHAVAVDGSGDIYSGLYGDIYKWSPLNNNLTHLVASSGYFILGAVVDSSGNVYFTSGSPGANAIYEWKASTKSVITLADTDLINPTGVAIDGLGDVYVADQGDSAIKDLTVTITNLTTLISAGLLNPAGIAVDGAGNLYIADAGNNAIKKWNPITDTLITLVSNGLSSPNALAVDGSGNIYIADTGNNAIKKWTAATETLTTLTALPLVPFTVNQPLAVAVDAAGNVYVANLGTSTVKELARAFVDTSDRLEGLAGGTDSLPVVLPTSENLNIPFAPYTDSDWLSIKSVKNGVVTFAFTATTNNRTGNIVVLGQKIPITQGGPVYVLGTTNLVEGPNEGSDSVVLGVTPSQSGWAATADDSWLHLSQVNQSGTGSTNVVFSYDANPGASRRGTLTIGGQTVIVTQAASTYVPVGSVTILPTIGAYPACMTVDAAGDIFVGTQYLGGPRPGDFPFGSLYEFAISKNTNTLLYNSEGFDPNALAVDSKGDLYFANISSFPVYEITSTGATRSGFTPGVLIPTGLATDPQGNLYISDAGDNSIKEWMPANSNLLTLVSIGLSSPSGVAVDAAGNVYITDAGDNSLKKWSSVNNMLSTLVSSNLNNPQGVAVDGSGNVYIADTGNIAIKVWSPANDALTVLASSGMQKPIGVAVDGARNVYISDTVAYYTYGLGEQAIEELPRAFVDTSARVESLAAGSDALPAVLPTNENLFGTFGPSSGEAWLAINGVTNGVVSFSFTTTNSNRTGYITLFGQPIPVVQGVKSVAYSLGASNLLEGPQAGSDSIVLVVTPYFGEWTATTTTPWLHINAGFQSGSGCTNVLFTFDANAGETRTGTLTVAGQSLSVTQAGSAYVPVESATALVSSGLNTPRAVALDGVGNVYIADTGNAAIKEWATANGSVTTIVSTGLLGPNGLAVDSVGNLYIADSGNAVREWVKASNSLITLASVQVWFPWGIVVDGEGNVIVSDHNNNAVKEWKASDGSFTTLLSLDAPAGLSLDAAGNLYIAYYGGSSIIERTAVSGAVNTLVTSDLWFPVGVATDGSGNVYIANYSVFKWSPATSNLITLSPAGLHDPQGIAVDNAQNVYFADIQSNTVKVLPHAFLVPTARLESLTAGFDALPAILPTNQNLSGPFAPTSDQPWLTITGITNGVVSFYFAANPGPARTANINLLGTNIPITQGTIGTSPILSNVQMLQNGVVQFAFTNDETASFTVLSTTNLFLPMSNWTVIGSASNIAPQLFEFTDSQLTNSAERFYRIRSP